MNLSDDIRSHFNRVGLGVSRETAELLGAYADALNSWQQSFNLIGPSTRASVIQRHFLDSAQLLDFAPSALRWIDMGAGAGFPGLVIAIFLKDRPMSEVHLIEANAKKCSFLRHVIRKTGAPAKVHNVRLERMAHCVVEAPDVVTARALASLDKLFEFAAPCTRLGATCLFPKGQGVDDEINEARKHWTFDFKKGKSRVGDGTILHVENLVKR